MGLIVRRGGPGPIDPINAEYRIVFAPLGGRLRNAQCHGLDTLTDFLRLAHVPLPGIERGLAASGEASDLLRPAGRPDASAD